MGKPVGKPKRLLAALLMWCACCIPALADVPRLINYQGYLTNAQGAPINGSATIVFSFYTSPSGGAALYAETQNVSVTNGVFNVVIGSVTPFNQNLQFDTEYYLGIKVGTDAEMTPRETVVSAPYAIRAASLSLQAQVLATQITGTIVSAQIGSGAVTTANLAANQQLPGCLEGQAVRRAGNGWTCYNLPPAIAFPPAPFLGGKAMAIAADGYPMLAGVAGGGGGAVNFVRCANANCTMLAAAHDFSAGVSDYVSIALGSDAKPVLAYRDASSHLAFIKCTDADCISFSTATVDGGSATGYASSIAIGTDGNPVISYFDSTLAKVKTAACTNTACSGAATITPLDGALLAPTSIVIAGDGKPLVAYVGSAARLKAAKCSAATCTGGATLTTLDATTSVGQVAMINGGDALPVIAYTGGVAHCSNINCTAVILGAPLVPLYSIAKAVDGLPLALTGAVSVVRCLTATCSSFTQSSPVDLTTSVTGGIIAVPPDGLPIIAYTSTLRIAKCSNASCTYP